eukprot:scaffold7887_cov127-Isochrysis_galbana.AAC.1
MQQVDLVDDHQPHQLRVGAVSALAGDDVPLLGRGDDELGLADLLLGQLLISRELVDRDTKGGQPVAEVGHHLLHQRLHRGHVDGFEGVEVDRAVGAEVQACLGVRCGGRGV